MSQFEELQEIVAGLLKVPVESIGPTTPLTGLLATSMGRARLDATLRSRLGLVSAGVYTVQTFGELCRLFGMYSSETSTSAQVVRAPSPSTATSSSVRIGIDIQAVADLPNETDCWETDFYQQHFTRQEIAYALLQAKPGETFAATWCAKEALRKADNQWMGVDWKLTEITHDSAGRPVLRSGEEPIPCSVSISHTNGFAIAVIAIAEVVPAPAPVALPQRSDEARQGSTPSLGISIGALIIALIAAAYSFLK